MLLEVKNLSVQFGEGPRAARAVNNVSLSIDAGETVALVGESGCGKSVTGLSLMRLIETPPGRITSGEICLAGQDLLRIPLKDMRKIRGSEIAMIFQEPMTSFNPVYTIGDQLIETVLLHEKTTLQQAHARAEDLLTEVGIPAPGERMRQYPHELSGGMKQRAMIAMGLLCNPQLLLADEPTTALDVTVQAQILDLLRELQARHNMAVLLITHDLAVVAETVKRVYVMYASEIVEHAKVEELFREPLHPYTTGLFKCLPKLGGRREELHVIPGSVPNPSDFPSGCHFHPRCPLAKPICSQESPLLEEKRPGRLCACHLVEKVAAKV
ncbi:MAG: ABC transporter ATP-binding protein [Planctomycetes bacterium]|nr:ABC transporter ATP-binding protein [Planctomycetota bacterium]